MSKLTLLLLILIILFQSPSFLSNQEKTGKLFDQLNKSDIVAIGVITDFQTVGKRLSEKQYSELRNLSDMVGGFLFTFQIETILGSSTDFKSGVKRPEIISNKILIYLTKDQFFLREERYQEGQRYIVFFKKLPEQNKLLQDLDRN